MTQKYSLIIGCLSWLTIQSCYPKKQAKPVSSIKTYEMPSVDQCSTNAMRERRTATYTRTTGCVLDTVSGSLAEKVHSGASALREINAIGKIVKSARNILQTSINLEISAAKTALCLRTAELTLSTNLTKELSGRVIDELSASIDKNVDNSSKSSFSDFTQFIKKTATFDTMNAWGLLNLTIQNPSFDNIGKFAGAALQSFADSMNLATACIEPMASLTGFPVPNIVKLYDTTKMLGNVATIGAITNCTNAAVMNAVDVATELECLEKDLQFIAEQQEKITRQQQNFCEKLKILTELPTTIPVLNAIIGDGSRESESRAAVCFHTIFSWGNCIAGVTNRDLTTDGEYSSIQERCEVMCGGYASRPNLNDELHRIANIVDPANPDSVLRTVSTAAQFCTRQGNPEGLVRDGLTPCIRTCTDRFNQR